jgi:hypothetical protein
MTNQERATVIINDGQTQWGAVKSELIAALDTLGWSQGRAMGLAARIEPDHDGEDADSPYTRLCESVQPRDIPADAAGLQTFRWYPAERAWLWEPAL